MTSVKFYFIVGSAYLAALLCIGCQPIDTSKSYGRVPYSAYPETYTLTNGKVVVVVAPQVGRIVGYHRVGEPNWLWINAIPTQETIAHADQEWTNYGGDRVWLAPQQLWPVILQDDSKPDTTTDGDPLAVTYSDARKIVLVSKISPSQGVRLTRTITLPDNDTTVRINHHLERVLENPHPVQIWTITQILLPQNAYLDVAEDRAGGRGIISDFTEFEFREDHDLGAARYNWPQKKFSKVGTYGRWVAAVYDKTIFAQYAPLDLADSYHDRANCEIFAEPDFQYLEMEMLTPLKYLPKGEAMDFTVTWKLLDTPLGANQKDVIKRIEYNAPKEE